MAMVEAVAPATAMRLTDPPIVTSPMSVAVLALMALSAPVGGDAADRDGFAAALGSDGQDAVGGAAGGGDAGDRDVGPADDHAVAAGTLRDRVVGGEVNDGGSTAGEFKRDKCGVAAREGGKSVCPVADGDVERSRPLRDRCASRRRWR